MVVNRPVQCRWWGFGAAFEGQESVTLRGVGRHVCNDRGTAAMSVAPGPGIFSAMQGCLALWTHVGNAVTAMTWHCLLRNMRTWSCHSTAQSQFLRSGDGCGVVMDLKMLSLSDPPAT